MAWRCVPSGMKALAAVVVVAALAAIWYLRSPSPTSAAHAATPAPLPSTAGAPAAAKPPQHATRLTPEQRRDVAERIASAHASRANAASRSGAPAYRAPARPSLPPANLDPDDAESFKTTLRSAMHEVVPMIAECYDTAGSAVPDQLTVRAHLTLTGDPDIGTLVDAPRATDAHDAPLPAGFDDCLRSTLQTIELPPLAEGDEVQVTYPFVFRRE